MIFSGFVGDLTLPGDLQRLEPTSRARGDASNRPWTDLLLRQVLKPFRWYFDQIDHYTVWTSADGIPSGTLGGGGDLCVLVCPKEELTSGEMIISGMEQTYRIRLRPGLCILWSSDLKISLPESVAPRVFWAISLSVPLLP